MTEPQQAVHDITHPVEALRSVLEPKTEPRPMAGCTTCHEPLISTFEFRGAEFYCQVCGAKFGWLSPARLEWTEERQARHDELRVLYDADRIQRDPVFQMVRVIRTVWWLLAGDIGLERELRVRG